MTNGLLDAIKEQVDPFYNLITLTPKSQTRTIYIFQFKAYRVLFEKYKDSDYPMSLYIGDTDTLRGWYDAETLTRWKDGDYSKCAERPDLFEAIEVHPDLRDYEIRILIRILGWTRTNIWGGSPECRQNMIATSYSQEVHKIVEAIKKRSEYYYEYERKHGYSPAVVSRKALKREDDMYRIPDARLIFDMCDKLKNLSKDVKIYVPLDAHGHFCDYLASMGFKFIYTDADYEYFPSKEYLNNPEAINLITRDEYNSMKFDVAIGNPPYGTGGNLAIKFLNNLADRVKPGGIILQVLPRSIRKDSSQNKIRLDLHCVYDEDCDPKDFPTGIDAVIQQWEVRNYNREKIQTYREHPDFKFLKYEDRYDADVFVGEYGDGPSGKVLTSKFTHYAKGHHFIKASPEIVQRLVNLEPEFRKVSMETNGRKHCCKHDLIKTYIKHYGTGHQE